MTGRVVTLELPLPPNRSNARWAHWSKEHKARNAYFRHAIALERQLRGRRPATFQRARIAAVVRTAELMDWDNLVARLKWPVDLLKHQGLIVDDKPGLLEWQMPRQEQTTPYGVTITLEELAP